MNSNTIMKSDVLDIIFENRNKAYGAYMLRKCYNARLKKSIGVTMVAVMIFTAFTFLPGKKASLVDVVDIVMGRLPEAVVVEKKKIEPAAMKQKEMPQKKASGTPVVTKEEIADSIRDQDPLEKTGAVDITGGGTIISSGTFAGPGDEAPPLDEPQPVKETIVDHTKPINNPDVMPQFPGGVSALRKYLERNLHNPRELEDGEKISVKINFIVGYDGKLKGFNLVEDGGSEFNNEVIRVLKRMPDWIPGKSKGQNVSVYHTIPVKFISEE